MLRVCDDAETGAAVLGISERSFHEFVKDDDITRIKVPGMRRSVFELRQIRAPAAKCACEISRR